MTTLLLTRHGHVEGIHPERFRGRAELPLTELGVCQGNLLDPPLSAYWRLAQDPCCINEAEIVDGRATMLRVNETAHLPA